MNFALTWDGRVSTRNRTASDFSSPYDKHRLLEIRATGDAVLVGRGTVEKDNMTMGLPDEELRKERIRRGQTEYPLRAIVTNSGKLDPELRVFREGVAPVLIFSTAAMPAATRLALNGKAQLHLAEAPLVDLREMLELLGRQYGVRRVVCEGGPGLFRSLLELGVVEELNLTFCPCIFGGETASTLTGVAGEFLSSAKEYHLEESEVIGEECFVRYRRKPVMMAGTGCASYGRRGRSLR